MIDNALALPLYHQVAGILRWRIDDGIYPAGGRLLSEDELAAEFEVSRATIRQAIGQLVMERRVVRRQADVEVCAQIDTDLGAPVLYVERIVHDTAGRPVEYVRSWYRGDRYEYAVTLDLGPDADANPYVQLA